MRDHEKISPLCFVHHVVHDYANLVSSGLLITDPASNHRLLELAPVNTHVSHAFYLNCRKMYEFFTEEPHDLYIRAGAFTSIHDAFRFCHWTRRVQTHMQGYLLHVGRDRIHSKGKIIPWTGANNKQYLDDFQGAWEKLMRDLKPEYRESFKQEIASRIASEFRHCGTLGREFILPML